MGWVQLLCSILNARRQGLLKLRPVSSYNGVYFSCLKEQCPVNCCWAFDMVTVTEQEVDKISLPTYKSHGVIYLERKNYPCKTKTACIAFENGKCSVYQSKPKCCNEYPWYKFDGHLYVDIGCPGIQLNIDINVTNSPSITNISDSSKFFSSLPNPVQKITNWILKNY